MATVSHYPTGWKIVETETFKDDKGLEAKRVKYLSVLAFGDHEEALAYAKALDCTIELRCECCGKAKAVSPEVVNATFMLTCKSCQAVPSTYSPPSDAEKGKACKKPRVIHELKREAWLAETRKEVMYFEMKTTGNDALDRALRLPCASKPQTQPLVATEVPSECQLCGCAITDAFVDGVVKGAGWAYFCPPCHKRDGIGLGTGRGQRYQFDGERYVKTEG